MTIDVAGLLHLMVILWLSYGCVLYGVAGEAKVTGFGWPLLCLCPIEHKSA